MSRECLEKQAKVPDANVRASVRVAALRALVSAGTALGSGLKEKPLEVTTFRELVVLPRAQDLLAGGHL